MKIWIIALNTFKEGIRARILYNLVFFAFLLIGFSYFLGQLSLGESIKVMKDFGLSAISLFGVLISIFVGIGLIYKEIEKRTIYTILSKPIARWQFIVGKYFGLCLILLVQLIGMWSFFIALLYLNSRQLYPELWIASLFIYLELVLITAVAIFFSSFSSPFLSALFTISFYIIGHCTSDLAQFAMKSKHPNPTLITVTRTLNRFYNLDYFNLVTEVVHGLPITRTMVVNIVGYTFFLSLMLLLVGQFIFSRRDFK